MDGKRGGSTPKFTAENIIPEIHGTFGNLTEIAKRVQCARITLVRAIEREPEIGEAIEQEKEWIRDRVEDVYIRRLLSGDASWPEVKHFLETQMRKRGYGKVVEKQGSLDVHVKLGWSQGMEENVEALESGEEPGGWELVPPPEGDDGE